MSKESVDWDLLSSYAGLLSLATLSIYVGSQASVPVRSTRSHSYSLSPDDLSRQRKVRKLAQTGKRRKTTTTTTSQTVSPRRMRGCSPWYVQVSCLRAMWRGPLMLLHSLVWILRPVWAVPCGEVPGEGVDQLAAWPVFRARGRGSVFEGERVAIVFATKVRW